jgi:MFS family permease
MAKPTAFAILILAHLCSMFAMGIGGALCDRIGRRTAMLVGSRTMLLAFIVFFPLVLSGNTLLIAVAIVFLLCAAQFHAGAQPAYFAEAFPTEIRYRGSAVAYNLAVVVGSSAPFAATLIQAHTGGATCADRGLRHRVQPAVHVGNPYWSGKLAEKTINALIRSFNERNRFTAPI